MTERTALLRETGDFCPMMKPSKENLLHHLPRLVDYTLLRAGNVEKTQCVPAERSEVEQRAQEALRLTTWGLCLHSQDISIAAPMLHHSSVKPIAVVGFPRSSGNIGLLVHEAQHAISRGAQEIDMVLNHQAFLAGNRAQASQEITAVVEVAAQAPSSFADKILIKVILETGALVSDAAIKDAAQLAISAGANFLKTSTGFCGFRGATVHDILLLTESIAQAGTSEKIGIKASGGIRTLGQALTLVAAGANRLGIGWTAAQEIFAERERLIGSS